MSQLTPEIPFMASLWIRSGCDMKVDPSVETYQVGAHFKALIEAILVASSRILHNFFSFHVNLPRCAWYMYFASFISKNCIFLSFYPKESAYGRFFERCATCKNRGFFFWNRFSFIKALEMASAIQTCPRWFFVPFDVMDLRSPLWRSTDSTRIRVSAMMTSSG